MKNWMLLLIVLILVGCVSNPVPEPDWSKAEREPKEVVDPVSLPTLCKVPWSINNTECWAALDKYDIVAAGNFTIAQANAEALRDTKQAYDALVHAGQAQQEVARFKQEMLKEERRQREAETWWYRSIILGGLLAWGLSN